MAVYSIKDLEKLSGIKAHTIRIWEKRYNVVHPKRTDTNIRFYSDSDLKKLLNISILNKHGYKISKIAELDNESLSKEIWEITHSTYSFETQMENLVIAMVDLDENKVNQIINNSSEKIGFENTILKIIYPFFKRVGILWQTGNINPAQEHFVSNIIRQKMIAAIDSLKANELNTDNTFVLFLPEGELHEIALLFLSYLIKKQGYNVIYMGQSVPMIDLKELPKTTKAKYYLTYVTEMFQLSKIDGFISQLSNTFKDNKVIITGGVMETYFKELPENVEKITTPNDLILFLKEIA